MGYNIRYLTPEDLLEIDPTGRGARKIDSYRETAPTPTPSQFRYKGSEAVQKYLEMRTKMSQHLPRYSIAWDSTGDSKCGSQGGTFSLEKMQEAFARSYDYAERRISLDLVLTGAQYLRRRIEYYAKRDGLPQFEGARITGTLGALPSMDVKGTFVCETLGMKQYRHVFPDLPGQRRQRLKDRVINMDSVLNVRYFELELNAMRYWLKTHFPEYFSGWINPKQYLRPCITRAVLSPFYSLELDFTHCDECMSLELVQRTFLYVVQPLLPPVVFELFSCFIEELFSQEIFFGKYLWTGKHNLLSGQSITNDVETVYDICLMLGTVLRSGLDPVEQLYFACGDDSTLILKGKGLTARQTVFEMLCQEATANGHIVSADKSRMTDETVRFCRREYQAAYAKDVDGDIYGVYPAPLAINSIYNPEYRRDDDAEVACATLQILDNLQGHPLWTPVIQMVGSSWRSKCVMPEYAPSIRDWWARVYGSAWSLENSPSYAKMLQFGLMFS